MIDNVKYYLGGLSTYPNGELFYEKERSYTVINGRNTSWKGKTALMYPSDYIFTYSHGVNDACYSMPDMCKTNDAGVPTSGWLNWTGHHQWTLTPYLKSARGIYVAFNDDNLKWANANNVVISSKPILYLKPKVKITSGDGTIDNAYKLSL